MCAGWLSLSFFFNKFVLRERTTFGFGPDAALKPETAKVLCSRGVADPVEP